MLCVACGTAVGQTYTTKMRHCVTGSGVVLRNLKYEEIMKKIGII